MTGAQIVCARGTYNKIMIVTTKLTLCHPVNNQSSENKKRCKWNEMTYKQNSATIPGKSVSSCGERKQEIVFQVNDPLIITLIARRKECFKLQCVRVVTRGMSIIGWKLRLSR